MCESEGIFLRYSKDATSREREEQRRAHDAGLVRLIPKYYRGALAGNAFVTSWRDSATLFDFINLFTAYAKQQGPAQQQFVTKLQAGLNENVLPRLKETASRTLTEMQPIVSRPGCALALAITSFSAVSGESPATNTPRSK